MFTVERLAEQMNKAATRANLKLEYVFEEDFLGMSDGATISTAVKINGKELEFLYGGVGDTLVLTLSMVSERMNPAKVKSALGHYEATKLGKLLALEGIGEDDDSLLLSYAFASGSNEENASRLQEIFSLMQSKEESEEFFRLYACFD